MVINTRLSKIRFFVFAVRSCVNDDDCHPEDGSIPDFDDVCDNSVCGMYTYSNYRIPEKKSNIL